MSSDDDSYTTRPELPQFRSAGEVTSYPAPQLRLPDRKTPLPLSPEGTALFPAPVREPTPPPRPPFTPKPPRKKRDQPTILFFAVCLIFVAVAGTVGLATYNDNAPAPTTSTTSPARLLPLYHPRVRPGFLRGMVTVRWSAEGYSAGDWAWHIQLATLARVTGATWVELPVLFTAVRGATPGAGAPRIVASVPSSASLAAGIAYAHALGLAVFVVPLVTLEDTADSWVGHLSFPSSTTAAGRQAEAGWFAAYWRAYAPYVAAATGEHAEALALATEWSDLAGSASAEGSWFALISKVRTAYPSGLLTYDLNWTEAQAPALPAWEKSPFLGSLGISAYAPLTTTRGPVPATEAAARWKQQVGALVDRVAAFSGKPVLLSEVGYRATGDAGYHPWEPTSPAAGTDQQQQATLLRAALSGALGDPHILGAFVWGWQDVERFSLSGSGTSQAAVKAMYTH